MVDGSASTVDTTAHVRFSQALPPDPLPDPNQDDRPADDYFPNQDQGSQRKARLPNTGKSVLMNSSLIVMLIGSMSVLIIIVRRKRRETK